MRLSPLAERSTPAFTSLLISTFSSTSIPPIRTAGAASEGSCASRSRNDTNDTTFCGRSFTSIGESCMT